MRPYIYTGVVLLCVLILTTFLAGGGDFTPPAPTPLPRQPHYAERLYSGGLDAVFVPAPTPSPTPSISTTPPPSRPTASLAEIEAFVCSYDWPCQQALNVMYCESDGIPTAYNLSGASGLFQMMIPLHAWRFSGWDYFDIPDNVAAAYSLYRDSSRTWEHWDCGYAAYG